MAGRWTCPALALVLVVTPFVGCIGGLETGGGGTDCHATLLTTAYWNDDRVAGQIRELPAAQNHGPLTGKLTPLDEFNLSLSSWSSSSDGVVVQEIEWDVRNRTGGSSLQGMNVFSVRFDGLVSVHLPETKTDREVSELLGHFLSQVTEADEETLDGWKDRFVDSRQDGFGPKGGYSNFQFQIDGPFNLSGVLNEMSEDRLTTTDVPGLATVSQDEWSLRLKASFERVDNGRTADEFWSISADGFDHVVVELPNVGDDPGALVDRIERVYADLGIDADPPHPEAIQTSNTCVPAERDRP